MNDSSDQNRLPPSMLGFVLAICVLPYFLILLGLGPVSPVSEVGLLFRSGPWIHIPLPGDGAGAPSLSFRLDLYVFATALALLVLAGAHFKLSRLLPQLFIGIGVVLAAFVDSSHFAATSDVLSATPGGQNPGTLASVLARGSAALIIILGPATLLARDAHLIRRYLLILVVCCITLLFGSAAATLFPILARGVPETALFSWPVPKTVQVIPFILLVSAGLALAPCHIKVRGSHFSLALLVSFIPHAAAQLYLVFGDRLPTGTDFDAAYLLRWFAYLVPLAGLGMDCLNAYYEKGARSEKEFLRSVIDTIPHMIFVRDREGTFRFANQGVADFYGLPVEQVEGHRLEEIHFDEKECERYLDEDHRMFQTRQELVVPDDRAVDAAGKELWVHSIKRPLEHRGSDDPLIIGISMDVSERKQAEIALSRSEHRHRLLIETMNDGMIILDTCGTATYFNDQFCKMIGYEAEEIRDHDLSEFVDQRGRHILRELLIKSRQGGRDSHGITWIRNDGKRLPTIISPAPLYDNAGNFEGTLAVVVDITDLMKYQEDLVNARDQAEASNRAKTEFLANMSHEIRTPMNCVIGLADLLLEMDPTPPQRRYLEMVQHSSRSLLALISDILDLSKIEAGQLRLEPIECNLQQVVSDIVSMMAFYANSQGLELVYRYDPAAPRRVHCDPGRLRQILTNLLNNAIKFTHHGYVYLEVELVDRSPGVANLRVSVRDTGIGIPPEKLGHIFGKFTQADTSTTRKYGGTGLGLAICQELVQKMGGEISARSEPHCGATFEFTLPLECAAEDEPRPRVKPEHIEAKVLVYSSLELAGQVLREQVENLGLRCDWVGETEEVFAALEHASRTGEPYRVALVDEQVGQMGHGDLVRTIRHGSADLPPDPSIALVTLAGLDEEAATERQLPVECDGLLNKPIHPPQLRALLNSALDCQAARGAEASCRTGAGSSVDINKAIQDSQDKREFHARVLVAEDNMFNQKVAILMLTGLGCEVEVANTGVVALDKILESPFDLVLMDCQMPELDGYEATGAIRRMGGERGRTPIVAMTAHAMQGDRERCIEAGMDDYRAKPITQAILREILGKYCPEKIDCPVITTPV